MNRVALGVLVAAGAFLALRGFGESCIVSGSTTRDSAEAVWSTVTTFDTWYEEVVWRVFDPFRLAGRIGFSLTIR